MALKKAKPAAKQLKKLKKPVASPKAASKSAPKAKAVVAPKGKKDAKKDLKKDAKVKGKKPQTGGAASGSSHASEDRAFVGPPPDKALPRATKLPAVMEALTKRELEQVLTVGAGRGVVGEGSLKGKLVLFKGFPYLELIGRDKRELWFLLQGPDQEVLPAYVDHKVSVSGLIKKNHNYGGSVDVRKYSAKKPEVVEVTESAVEVAKLRFLSPGEVAQVSSTGMGVGVKGFAAIRGVLEMTGEDYFLVIAAGGTRHQVSFVLEGKGTKGLRKLVGETVQVTGVLEKTSGWGGTLVAESAEPRAPEMRVDRKSFRVKQLEASGSSGSVIVGVNEGLSVRFPEKAGYTWAIEPNTAKRISLREANFELTGNAARREFFFTPRLSGEYEVEFFLAKALNPLTVSKMYRLKVEVKPETAVAA